MLISSADGGEAINDAVRVTYRLVDLGRRLAGVAPMPPPKEGAQFHFSLPGSVQGFRVEANGPGALRVSNEEFEGGRALSIRYEGLGAEPAAVLTPTFTAPDVVRMRTYELMATPCSIRDRWFARACSRRRAIGRVEVALRALVYDRNDALSAVDGDAAALAPGAETVSPGEFPTPAGNRSNRSVSPCGRGSGRQRRSPARSSQVGWRAGTSTAKARRDERFLAPLMGQQRQLLFQELSADVSHLAGSGRRPAHSRHAPMDRLSRRRDVTVNLAEYAGVGVRVQGLRRYTRRCSCGRMSSA